MSASEADAVMGGRRKLDAGATALLERYFELRLSDAPELLDSLETVELAGGQWLFRQGDPGSALFFLVRGRLKAWRDLDDGPPGHEGVLLGEILPGESVGEVGMLTGHGRSAGVRATRDSLLVRVDRHAFELMARRNPSLVMRLAASVAGRLRQNMQPGASGSRAPKAIALLPLGDSPRIAAFCDAFAAGLASDGRTIDIAREALGAIGAPVPGLGVSQAVDEPLKHWLGDLEIEADRLVYRCDAAATPWSEFCLRQADLVLRVAEASTDPAPRDWEQSLEAGHRQSGGARQALVLLQPEAAAPITGTLAWLQRRRLDYHLHVRADRPDDLQRVLRIITGSATGLVLGAGAVRGFAHLGVNRAMREAGVPIDWIGGSSIGAIMGAAIANDWSAEQTTRAAFEAFVQGKPFSDYTLPLVSLLAGGRMRRLLRKHLPGNIEDLPIPFFCTSSNLSTGKINLHQRGPLWQVLSASASLPGVMPPSVHQGQLAIDGSVLNSLPVDLMQEMPVGRVIAVDLSTRKDYLIDYEHVPSGWALLLSRLSRRKKRIRLPGLATLMLKSTEIGTVARVRDLGARADLLLAPAVYQFSILDVSAFHRIVEAGYEHARARLPDWLLSRQSRPTPAEAVPGP